MGIDINNVKGIFDDLYNEITSQVDEILHDTVNTIYLALLEPKSAGGTPVITGWLRSNWVISLGIPISTPTGDKLSVGVAKANQDKKFSAFSRLSLLETRMIYISNPTPYAKDVNDGDGIRGGQRFMEKSIDRGIRALNDKGRIK